MTSIVIQMMKYVLMFLFLGYIFGAFYVFRYEKAPEKQKNIYVVQKILLYAIHGLGFLCLYLKNHSVELLGFYLMQVLLISIIFIFYHYVYKRCSVLLVNNMCLFLVTSMIILTRISFQQAFKQFLFLAVGTVIMLIIPLFFQKGSIFRDWKVLYFVVGVVLLGVVTVLGATSYGAKLTLSIGGFSFQPSEFVKIVFIFFIASMLYKKSDLKQVFLTSILSAIFVLLLVASKDLGGALLYFMAYLIMIYVASQKAIYLGAGFGLLSVAAVAGYFLFSHVQTRVFVWLNPTADIDNQGYQICQSLFAIGTGGWFGLGLGEGLPKKIPIVEKDFIFSAISEEMGAIVGVCLILLCLSCFIMIIHVAIQMKDKFFKLVAVGLAVLYATQVILTIGGVIKFIPSTGVTLPLVSYGGSSLLSTMIMFGIVQGLYMRKAALETSSAKSKEKKNSKDKGASKKKKEVKLQEKNTEFHVVTYMFTVIFVAMIGYFTFFLMVESESFINNEYNGLQALFEEDVKRGEIITSDGYVIAETIIEDGVEKRRYPYGEVFAHATGYSSNVKTGLEKQLNFTVLRSHAFFIEQLACDLTGEKKMGDNVVTTLRYDLQQMAYDALGNYDGAVVVMEPSTGNILAMVSKPTYNPNSIEADWEMLQEGSALYNRATQGQYTPGSIFKMVTTLAYIEDNPDTYKDFSYECMGEATINGKIIHCASNKKHGDVDLETAFSESCNTAFAYMMQDIKAETLNKVSNAMLFNQNLPIAFESSVSKFGLLETDASALKIDTAIGQGKTLTSPLHMAMVASAICNDGMVMRPNLIQRVENYKGILVEEKQEKEYKKIFTEEQLNILKDYMARTVEDGTAESLKSDMYAAFGKTGTAQTTSDLDKTNAWFIGFAVVDGKELAIAVVVEDSGTGNQFAVPVAKKIFDLYFE